MPENTSSPGGFGTFFKSLFVFLVIAQVGALGWLVYRDWDHGRIQADHQSKIKALEQSLDRVAAAIERQSSVLDRTIGKVVPVRMPASWSERLAELERVAADQSRWPQTDQAAHDYLDSTSNLISELPPWAESEYMGRLNLVRWSAMVFTTIYPGTGEVDLHARAEVLAALGESAPDGANTKLIEHVDREQARLVRETDDADWQLLRQRAAGYIAEPQSATSSSIQQDIALLLAYSNSGDTTRRDEVDQLIAGLRKIMLRREAEQQVQSLKSRMASLKHLKEKDPSLFEAGIGVLLGEVRSSRMNLALSGLELESLTQIDAQLLAELSQQQVAVLDDQETARAQSVRAYQQYALKSIERFNKRFQDREKIAEEALKRIREGRRDTDDYADHPSVQHAIKNAKYRVIKGRVYDSEEYELDGTKESLESHLTHRICRDSMVTCLLPIDLRLLEMPVQALFQQAWQSGWKCLDGRADQTNVAERTVDVKKTTLADVQGGRR